PDVMTSGWTRDDAVGRPLTDDPVAGGPVDAPAAAAMAGGAGDGPFAGAAVGPVGGASPPEAHDGTDGHSAAASADDQQSQGEGGDEEPPPPPPPAAPVPAFAAIKPGARPRPIGPTPGGPPGGAGGDGGDDGEEGPADEERVVPSPGVFDPV